MSFVSLLSLTCAGPLLGPLLAGHGRADVCWTWPHDRVSSTFAPSATDAETLVESLEHFINY